MAMSKSEAGRLGSVAAKATIGAHLQERQQQYAANPKLCKQCQNPIAYEKRHESIFCDQSCAGVYNNAQRVWVRKVYTQCSCGADILKRNNKWCVECISKSEHVQARIKLDLPTIKSANGIRAYLLRTRPYACENPECGLSVWCGQPIPLEMDHIDGDSENNTEENLRLICVNCHALTPTYRNKNKGNGRHARRQRYADGKSY